MAVIARAEVTLALAVDVERVDTWHMLLPSASAPPRKPSVADPSADGWTLAEPGYDGTSTVTLYTCQRTTLTDGTFYWGAVSVSSSYEAAKQASNRVSEIARTLGDVTIMVSERATTEQVGQAIADAGDLIYDHTYTKGGATYTFVASLRMNGEDVTDRYDPDRFVWWLRGEGGDVLWARGPTMTVSEADVDYRTSVVGGFEDEGAFADARLVDAGGTWLVASDGAMLTARMIWED